MKLHTAQTFHSTVKNLIIPFGFGPLRDLEAPPGALGAE